MNASESYAGGRVQPQAVPLEEAVLGALMLDKRAILALPFLQPEHFYDNKHVLVFRAIKDLDSSGQPIDLLTVIQRMKAAGTLSSVGPAYLAELTQRVASSANVEYHARILQQKWVGRELIRISTEAIGRAYDETEDSLQLLDDVTTAIAKVRRLDDFRGMTAAEAVDAFLELAKKAYDTKGQILGRPFTGIPSVDLMTQGLEPGDYMVIGARPKMGKSSFLNTCLKQHVADGTSCYACSGEMINVISVARLLAAESTLSTQSLRMGKFYDSKFDQEKFDHAMMRVKESKIIFDDGGLSLPKVRTLVSQGVAEGIDTFYFDRLELFQEFIQAGNNWLPALKTVNSELRNLANRNKVSIVSFVQGNLEGEKAPGKRMEARHFYGGTPVQEAVTKALALYRPEGFNLDTFEAGKFEGQPAKGRAEIYMLLATSYETGSEMVGFNATTQSFYELGAKSADIINPPEDEDLPF